MKLLGKISLEQAIILKQEPNVRPRSFAGKPFRGSVQLTAAQEIFKGTLWGSR
jgi:hypothetical protein